MKIVPPILLLITLLISNALAWEGIDQENNSMIEIPPGNLVREGLMIEFYENDILHNGRVLVMNEMAAGTELTIEDFNDDKQEKTFIMQ
jgi:hypothetical protein